MVEVCRRLLKEDINRFALQVALEHALKERWEELAWVLLQAMREAGLPLREHYFWPILHHKAIAQEPAGRCHGDRIFQCDSLMEVLLKLCLFVLAFSEDY